MLTRCEIGSCPSLFSTIYGTMETRFSVYTGLKSGSRQASYIAAVLCPVQSGFNSSFNLVCTLLTYRVGVGGGSARRLSCSSQLAIKEGDS